MIKTVFDVLNEKLTSEIDNASLYLSGGSAQDYAAYSDACGAIRGLRIARDLIQDLARNYEVNDD